MRVRDNGFRSLCNSQTHFVLSAYHLPAQRVREYFDNLDVHKLTDHVRGAFKIHHAVIFGSTRQFHDALTGGAFHQNTLDSTEHTTTPGVGLLVDTLL